MCFLSRFHPMSIKTQTQYQIGKRFHVYTTSTSIRHLKHLTVHTQGWNNNEKNIHSYWWTVTLKLWDCSVLYNNWFRQLSRKSLVFFAFKFILALYVHINSNFNKGVCQDWLTSLIEDLAQSCWLYLPALEFVVWSAEFYLQSTK